MGAVVDALPCDRAADDRSTYGSAPTGARGEILRRAIARAVAGLSVADPEWSSLERAFVAAALARGLPEPRPLWAELENKVTMLLGLFGDATRSGDSPSVAFEELGFLALRPERWEELEVPLGRAVLRLNLRMLRRFIWAEIEGWAGAARCGRDAAERRAGAKAIRRFADAVAGQRRGRRNAAVVDPAFVRVAYAQVLFRLRCARAVMAAGGVSAGRCRRAEVAAKRCGLGVDVFMDHLRLDEDGKPKGRPISPEYQARIWTATAVGVREHTIANILSKRAGHASRK